jgi:hypothetical protein
MQVITCHMRQVPYILEAELIGNLGEIRERTYGEELNQSVITESIVGRDRSLEYRASSSLHEEASLRRRASQ